MDSLRKLAGVDRRTEIGNWECHEFGPVGEARISLVLKAKLNLFVPGEQRDDHSDA